MVTNGVHPQRGLTTPDSEEALVKKKAMERCAQCFVLADSSKIGQVTSITFSDMKESEILTTELKDSSYKKYKNIVEVK